MRGIVGNDQELLRATLILVCGMLMFNLPTLLYKIRMLVRGALYFLFCWDKSWKKPEDPNAVFQAHISQNLPVERKNVYFVRHGESTWNETFNKGSHRSLVVFAIGFLPGVIKSLLYELYLLLSGKLDSWFYDSPLSNLGLVQAKDLANFLLQTNSTLTNDMDKEHFRILRADPGAPRSKIVCSNLRRAISTLVGAFSDRLSRHPDEKILIIPALQEISRNPDTLSITPPHTLVQASWLERTSSLCNFQEIFNSQVDMSLHTGDKPLNTNGYKRMRDFCELVFSPSVKEEYVIAGGHSIWFRSFFKTFLPENANHIAKHKKICNGGIVTFTLLKAETKRGPKFMIEDQSIRVVYGGFS